MLHSLLAIALSSVSLLQDDAVLLLTDSYPAEGSVVQLPVSEMKLSFNQEVSVKHSVFDAAACITNLTSGGFIQLNIEVDGNVVNLSKGSFSSSDFMAGQSYRLDINAGHIISVAHPELSYPASSIYFSVEDFNATDGLRIMSQRPAAGEVIRNAGNVIFNMDLTSVDPEKISLVNENGHEATLSYAGIDVELTNSLIFNIDETSHLEENTTYKLHLNAGAITAGDLTNEEMDAAYWCIPAELFGFSNPTGSTCVPQFDSFVVTTESDGIEICGDVSGIKVTGVGSNSNYVYANLTNCELSDTEHGNNIALAFDKLITPALLAECGALYNSVKVVIPEKTFSDNRGRLNKQSEFLVYVVEEKEIGEQTWTFNPENGAEITQLGAPMYAEEEDGTIKTYYNITFAVSGENVYARIPDASLLYIGNRKNNQKVRTFGRNDIYMIDNQFTLSIGNRAITEPGSYELVIPAEAIYLYSDDTFQTNPIHPSENVIASWTITDMMGILTLQCDERQSISYDLWGHPSHDNSGIRIKNGTKQIILK